MRNEAKITSKGQITVPIAIRRSLGAGVGDRLVFELDEGGVRVRAVRKTSRFAAYRGIGNPGVGPGRAAVVRVVRELRGE
ncbi:MAG: AbrB/MazE/SpoVT family DNA-binding domain-containing protein [Acidobacteria bacterium]|nr:AbrB/MazE/SpoVT family DNA-binding domain-containing protein [Acidobacteriota bacterium]